MEQGEHGYLSLINIGSRFWKYVRRKRWTFLSIALIVPLGFYTKFYPGPASGWVNNSLGGILYVVFWSLLGSLLVRKSAPWKMAALAAGATCLLEFLQLWHPLFLERIRSTLIGVTLLGNSFSFSDLVYYAIGFMLSGISLTLLDHQQKKTDDAGKQHD